MTNTEKFALNTLANRIKSLASMENAMLGNTKEESEEIKEKIRFYMHWFEHIADEIEDVVKLSEEKGYAKKERLEEIIRLNI